MLALNLRAFRGRPCAVKPVFMCLFCFFHICNCVRVAVLSACGIVCVCVRERRERWVSEAYGREADINEGCIIHGV